MYEITNTFLASEIAYRAERLRDARSTRTPARPTAPRDTRLGWLRRGPVRSDPLT